MLAQHSATPTRKKKRVGVVAPSDLENLDEKTKSMHISLDSAIIAAALNRSK
jgi:hypothetical protein